MNKTLIFLVLALLIAGAAYFVLERKKSKLPGEDYPERQLAVDESIRIAKIFIADQNGRTMTFTRQPDENWLINDEFVATPAIISEMTNVLHKIRIDHVPPAGVVAKVMESFKTTSLKVASFDASGNQLNSILIGPATQDERNSYVIREGYNSPFAVRVPGLSGSLRPLFDLRSVESFRSKDFVDIDPTTVEEVKVAYARQPGESLVIYKREQDGKATDFYLLNPLNQVVAKNDNNVDQRFLYSYLEGFAHVPHQGRITKETIKDSIRGVEPFMVIDVKQTTGSTELKIYPNYITNPYGEVEYDEPIPTYFVLRDNDDLVSVQTPQMQSWLRGYSNFFE